MDNWVLLLIVAAVAATIFVYLRFGKSAAAVLGSGLALLIAYLAGRRGQRTEIENEVARGELKNEIRRNKAIVRADQAADAVRDLPVDELRQSDPFERR